MILYEKIKNQYTAKNIRETLPTILARNINRNRKRVSINVVVKYIDFKSIGYSSADLAEDYP